MYREHRYPEWERKADPGSDLVADHQLLTLLFLYAGNTDIQNGNVKLILGLIWSLIAHYQLGASNFPPKKLMLAWLKVGKGTI